MKVLENPCKRISKTANKVLQENIVVVDVFAEAFFEWNNALGDYAFEVGSLCTLAAVAGLCTGCYFIWRRAIKKLQKYEIKEES